MLIREALKCYSYWDSRELMNFTRPISSSTEHLFARSPSKCVPFRSQATVLWRQGDARIKTKQNEAINYFLKVSEGEKETSSHNNIYLFLCKRVF